MSCCPPSAPGRNSPSHTPASEMHGGVTREWANVPAGDYLLGTHDPDANPGDGEGPPRMVRLGEFAIAATTVTNGEFAEFVAATKYRTEAEQLGWSFVFHDLVSPKMAARVRRRSAEVPWWHMVEGACWRWPGGRGSHIAGKEDHPVVHVSWNDAIAYCAWSGTRLPTEAEWEASARGGLIGARFPWGDDLLSGGNHMCNIWQGDFPNHDDAEDGFHGTCPVRSFPPNGFGLYEVAGNVWEWTSDWWTTGLPDSLGADSHGKAAKVMRGGSFLCHESYCNRYRVAGRTSNTPDSASSNIGFRVAQDPD